MTASGFEEISPHRKYHGISVQIIGKIKNVRVSFNIDMGIGDAIVPHAMEQKIQTQLPDFESPAIFTYSLESTIAEKFDAILHRVINVDHQLLRSAETGYCKRPVPIAF